MGCFEGDGNACEEWIAKVQYLRKIYQLTDEAARVMAIQRLKGKAAAWLYSQQEHLSISVNELLDRLKQMFQAHTSKMLMRKQFEERQWKKEENL